MSQTGNQGQPTPRKNRNWIASGETTRKAGDYEAASEALAFWSDRHELPDLVGHGGSVRAVVDVLESSKLRVIYSNVRTGAGREVWESSTPDREDDARTNDCGDKPAGVAVSNSPMSQETRECSRISSAADKHFRW